MNDERRASPRHKVEIDIEERTDGAVYFQRSRDISRTGVHLAGTLAHPPGTRVSLLLRLPNAANPIAVDGTVIGRSPDETGMAIAFAAPVALSGLSL